MDPEYKRKLREAEEWDDQRRQREARDLRPVKIPNMERMPLGCVMWIVGAVVLAYFLIQNLMTR